MEKWFGRVALVTGASSGIGAEICTALVENGMQVIGIARRLNKMKERAFSLKDRRGKLFPYKCDLTKDEEVYKLFEYINKSFNRLDVCVNNAGIVNLNKSLLEIDLVNMRETIDVNVVALCLCSKLAISFMRKKNINDGHIINTNSIMGHTVYNYKTLHFYTASKYAVTALTEGIRQELKGIRSGIRISSVSPSLVRTKATVPITDNPRMKEFLKDAKYIEPSSIADTVVYILSTPATVEINDITITPTFDVNWSVIEK